MKTNNQTAQTTEHQSPENKPARIFTCALCLSIFPLMYIVGKTVVQILN
ncbi:MAG: hypothetical protein H6563_05100 [Lewinellaceae bacterium]|nr:hypothetical protein [Lewinellaceae bacterium]